VAVGAFTAALACGAAATSTPAIATAGAALPAFSATFSTGDGVVCRPVRRIFRPRRSTFVASTELPNLFPRPPTRARLIGRIGEPGQSLSVTDEAFQNWQWSGPFAEAWQQPPAARRGIEVFL
jgi:hypothetical protein